MEYDGTEYNPEHHKTGGGDTVKKLIKKCINLSKAAYGSVEEIRRGIPGEIDWIENEKTDTQAFICHDEEYAYVAVRGTEFDNLEDWFTNLNCGLAVGPFGNCHAGFTGDMESIITRVASRLTKHEMAGRKIVITGHSQGAAVALLLFLQLSEWNQIPDYCIPVACPRCLSRATASTVGTMFKDRLFFPVNNNDIVTRIPTRAMGFRHPDRRVYYFDWRGELDIDLGAWGRFKDRVAGRIDDLFEMGTDGVKDHLIPEYVRLTHGW